MSHDSLRPSHLIGRLVLSSSIAIATFGLAPVAMANNMSDVTGANMSDVTGPNMSDVTGPNQSDNTGTNQSDNTGTNQSDNTGTNQSDNTGTNLSDNTGTNPSDNPDPDTPTVVLSDNIDEPPIGSPSPDSPNQPSPDSPNQPTPNSPPAGPIFSDVNGNPATLGQALNSFFNQFGDDLDIGSSDDLRAKITQAQAACNAQPNEGSRRFALTPRTPQFNQACQEFNQLVDSIRQTLEQGRQENSPTNAVQTRLW